MLDGDGHGEVNGWSPWGDYWVGGVGGGQSTAGEQWTRRIRGPRVPYEFIGLIDYK